MELVGCAACEWPAGGGGEDAYISSIYISTRTHEYTLHIYVYVCMCVCIVCDTDTKGPKGELRPTFVQPRFLPQGHRIYTCV